MQGRCSFYAVALQLQGRAVAAASTLECHPAMPSLQAVRPAIPLHCSCSIMTLQLQSLQCHPAMPRTPAPNPAMPASLDQACPEDASLGTLVGRVRQRPWVIAVYVVRQLPAIAVYAVRQPPTPASDANTAVAAVAAADAL